MCSEYLTHRTVKYSLNSSSLDPGGAINKYVKKEEKGGKKRNVVEIYTWNTWGGVLHKYPNALAAAANIDNALSSRILVKVPRRAEQQVPRST